MMGNFLGPLSNPDDQASADETQEGYRTTQQSPSTASKADYRVSPGFEWDSDLSNRKGVNGPDDGQQVISQDKGWDSQVASEIVDENYHLTPDQGLKPAGPDQQGQLLRGFVLNEADATGITVESEGIAAQKGSMYEPRVRLLNPDAYNPSKGV